MSRYYIYENDKLIFKTMNLDTAFDYLEKIHNEHNNYLYLLYSNDGLRFIAKPDEEEIIDADAMSEDEKIRLWN